MSRRKTRTVYVGNIPVGSEHPIRVQSMTTSDTRDAEKTIEQIIRLADAGCEIARVTVQGIKEAESCEAIKNGLVKRGYNIPLVADIHFFPPAALRVADFVDKIRINPGNFADKRAQFRVIEYDDATYAQELEKIEEKFAPLLEKCKRLKRAMRIGVNHGSLSDRIMNRYGDTPAGMIESALEFTRIARKYDYHDLIFSMKSSNPLVMIEAYRLLAIEMEKLGWDYPFHLGVTEAGEGEDGRIKSAIGIGSLLLDGIGDTIRVSLTEDPWYEIEPCKKLVSLADRKRTKGDLHPFPPREVSYKNLSFFKNGTVAIHLTDEEQNDADLFKKLGFDVVLGQPAIKNTSIDMIIVDRVVNRDKLKKLAEIGVSVLSYSADPEFIPILDNKRALFSHRFPLVVETDGEIPQVKPDLIILKPKREFVPEARAFFKALKGDTPVILAHAGDKSPVISISAEIGSLFCDNRGEGVMIDAALPLEDRVRLSFNLLQASRKRITKTDFISCPSCGRTLFDLQTVTKKIRDRTAHLAGVKIAIMGCIVNGPGEMADADFGYVGSKPGKIDLYVGKSCVEKDIEFDNAVDKLVDLIKTHNRWVEPVLN